MNKRLILMRMKKSQFFIIGSVVAAIIILGTVFAPFIITHNPLENSLADRLVKPALLADSNNGYILGTDQMGRDIFSRLLIGGRSSLAIAFTVTILACAFGTIMGLVSGYRGGKIDTVIMRMCDVFLAIPNMVLAIAIMAILGSSIFNLIFVLVITSWVQYCRMTRNNVLVIKNMEFTHASKVLGASNLHIMFKQILPNVTTPLIILFTCQIGETIMLEAGLSFLSLGIQPPAPSWGNMIAGGRDYLSTCPWLVFSPGIALMITVLAFNFLGDGVRDVLDPKRT